MILLLTIASLFLDEPSARPLTAPIVVEFCSGQESPVEIAGRSQLRASFLPSGKAKTLTAEEVREGTREYSIENPIGFEQIRGIMYCLESAGGVSPIAFGRCASQEVFEQYVRKRLNRARATSNRIERNGNHVRIIAPPPQIITDPNGTIRTVTSSDLYFNFGKQLLVFGGESAFRAPIGAAEEIVQRGAGKSWGYWFKPSNISPGHRNLYTAAFDAQIGAWQQRRDAESQLVGRLRKLLGENMRTIANTLLDDIDEAFLWTQNATIDRDFETHLKVTVRPDSTLSGFLASLRSFHDTRLASAPRDDSYFSAYLNVQIPSNFREEVSLTLSDFQSDAPDIVSLLQAIIDSRSIQCELNATNASNDDSAVLAAVDIPEDYDAVKILRPLIPTATLIDNGISIPVPQVETLGKVSSDVLVTQTGKKLQLHWSTLPTADSNQSADKATEPKETAQLPVPASTIFHAEGDFSKVTPETQLFIVQCMERQAQQWRRKGLPPHLVDRWEPIKLKHSEQIWKTLQSRGNTNVSMHASINDDGTELTCNCTVGRNLVGAWLALQQLHQ